MFCFGPTEAEHDQEMSEEGYQQPAAMFEPKISDMLPTDASKCISKVMQEVLNASNTIGVRCVWCYEHILIADLLVLSVLLYPAEHLLKTYYII